MQVDTHQAEANLAELLERAAAGEDVVIADQGQPLARLVPVHGSQRPRRPGLWRGQVWMAGDFDTTPGDVADGFGADL